MHKSPLITVAIPTYNREDVLVNTINDALNSQTLKDIELIVVDQTLRHSAKTEKFLTKNADKRLRYYKIGPPSVTIARNFALAQAKTPYIIFLDDDVRLDKNLFETFLNTFEKMPQISAIAGRVMQKGYPIAKDVLKFDKYAITHGTYTATKPGYTNAFPGGNCAMRVKEALALGGFDTRYRGNAFREENDMSLRLANAGYLIYYEPKAELLHLAAPSGGNRVKTHIYDNPGFYKNELFFTLRFAHKGYKLEALRKKYHDYCLSVRHKQAYIRRYYFFSGLIAAIWRLLFVKQKSAQER